MSDAAVHGERDDCCFAGTVGAKEAQDATCFDIEIDIVDRRDLAITARDMFKRGECGH
jgi:hypothetical protein